MPDVPQHVFISYSRTDSVFVDRLEQDLKAQGLHPWIDRRKLEGGQKWGDEIQKAIDQCQALVVIVSPEAMASRERPG